MNVQTYSLSGSSLSARHQVTAGNSSGNGILLHRGGTLILGTGYVVHERLVKSSLGE